MYKLLNPMQVPEDGGRNIGVEPAAEGRPAEEVLRELGARWVKTAVSDGAMLAALVGESRHHPEAAAAMTQVSGGSVKRLAGYGARSQEPARSRRKGAPR